ncbi:MAG: restriction endonuclease [Phycisphaerae bacterium]|nr:restriction endonuclease [Phycisphaerae bacterium]
MRDYRLHDLADEKFEELVGVLCRSELGTGTMVFSKGRDGGRDGRFQGTAERFPSEKAPWSGKFIIQAKHTNNPIASCSDGKFHGNKSSVVAKEIPRIKALKEEGEIDNYILFTNRKQPGDAAQRVCNNIVEETGVENVQLVGIENLSRMITLHWGEVRKVFPELAQAQGPLRFYRQDIAEVLDVIKMALADHKGSAPSTSFSYIDLDRKNELNNLSERYFRHMQAESSPYFGQIQDFLRDPINRDMADAYDNIAAHFNNTVTVNRDDFAKFDMVFQQIHDILIERNPTLEKRSRLIFTLLHYMYWACDLGEKADDKTNTSS